MLKEFFFIVFSNISNKGGGVLVGLFPKSVLGPAGLV